MYSNYSVFIIACLLLVVTMKGFGKFKKKDKSKDQYDSRIETCSPLSMDTPSFGDGDTASVMSGDVGLLDWTNASNKDIAANGSGVSKTAPAVQTIQSALDDAEKAAKNGELRLRDDGRVMDDDGKLRDKVFTKRQLEYKKLFPDEGQLLPGKPVHWAEDENDAEEIKEIQQQTNKLLTESKNVEDLLKKITTGQGKLYIPELISSLTEMVRFAGEGSPRTTAFIGPQSVGKSFVENLMTLLGLGVSSAGLGTKALVHYELRRTKVEYYAIFGQQVTYEEIYAKLQKKFESMKDVENINILIQIHAPWVPFQADYLDVPGISATEETSGRAAIVFDMIRSLATREKIDFVVVGDANIDPESCCNKVMKELASANVQNENILPVLNKVNLLLQSNNSAEENRMRINNWAKWFGQQPFLFAASKEKEFDTLHNLPPRQQVERWKKVVDEGDRRIEAYAAAEMPDYPKDLLGIDKAVQHVKTKLVNDVMAVVDEYVDLLKSQMLGDLECENKPLNGQALQNAFVEFIREFPEAVENVGFNKYAVAFRIKEFGGHEFLETPEVTDKRNEAAVRHFKYSKSQQTSKVAKDARSRKVYCGDYQDAVKKSDGYFGTRIMQHDFNRHRLEIFTRFKEFSDKDLQYFVENSGRDAVQGYDEAISIGVSELAKQLEIRDYIKNVINRQACIIRRIYRTAFWLYMENNANNLAMTVLLKATKFREKVQQIFDDDLKELVKDSQVHMERVFGELIDARLSMVEPLLQAYALSLTFIDLKEKESVDLTAPPPPLQLDWHAGVGVKKPEWDDVWKFMRKAIRAHYSVRILKAVEIFSNHFDATWVNLRNFLKKWLIKVEAIGRNGVLEVFDLQSAAANVSGLDDCKKKYKNAVNQALSIVGRYRRDLGWQLDNYNPVRDYAFDFPAA